MDSTEWLFEQLADHVCTVPIDSPTLDHLRTRVSDLEALITVHSLLEHTAVQLRESAPLKSGAQKKVEKFLDLIYNDFDRLHCEKPERVYKLRSLDYGTFLLITASCTPIDLIKITDHVFQHVIKNAPKYLERHTLPRKWMFRKEFQMAIVGKAHLAGITEFKRSLYSHPSKTDLAHPYQEYHELEFSMDPLDDEEPRRRVCIGSGRGDPSPAGLPDVSSGGNHPQSSRGQENTSRPCAYQIGDTIDPTDSTDQMEQGTKDRGQTGLPGSPMTNSIAEQENQKRLMTDGEEQEHALKRHQTWRYGSSRSGSAMEEEASEEYRKQLSGLEEEKKKRLLMARKERERMGQAPNTTSTSPIQVRQMAQGTPRNQTIPSESSQSESLRRHALEEYEIQLRLLEDQKRIIENQKRKR